MVKLCIIRFGCKTVQFSNLSLKKKHLQSNEQVRGFKMNINKIINKTPCASAFSKQSYQVYENIFNRPHHTAIHHHLEIKY